LREFPKLEKPIARFPAEGSNLVEKGFPKHVAPGEPEPVFVAPRFIGAALPRLKEGRVYINASAAVSAADVAPGFSPAPAGLKASATKALRVSAT